jgi:hypothetical protein
MNQPWLTTIDWPVNAFDPKEAKNKAVCATSSTVVNSPSTVSLSITFLITSCSEMPSSFACSGICILNGVVIAEIQLKRETEALILPNWVGKEVTGDPLYKKINMRARALKP